MRHAPTAWLCFDAVAKKTNGWAERVRRNWLAIVAAMAIGLGGWSRLPQPIR
jgi:hypothetical protein